MSISSLGETPSGPLTAAPAGLDFTCLLPVHAAVAPADFEAALASVAASTLPPSEILVCQDGPLPPMLETSVLAGCGAAAARIVVNPGPRGLHHNLNHAADEVRTAWIARMDADDLCLPDRFEAQARFLAAHPEIDILGGAILEFQPDGRTRRRIVPPTHAEILRWSLWRNPMNHMTVMFRTDLFRRCGGYPGIPFKEDYALWLRMLGAGARFANLPGDLVRVRLGEGFHGRRSGLRNLSSEWALYRVKREVPGLGDPGAGLAFLARAAALSLGPAARLLYEGALRRPSAARAGSDQ